MFRKRSPRYLLLEDFAIPQKPARSRPALSILCIALFAAMAVGGWRAAYAETANAALAPATLTLDDVDAGQLLFSGAAAGNYQPAINLANAVDINITGMVAHVTLSQTFQNTSAEWLEGVYVFPLPDEAAVNALQIRIGERVIEGEIHEKQQAKAIYRQAKLSGRKAALVEQERPNLFTNSIANIAPGEIVEVEIQYLQAVSYASGVFGLRFPMTITPRYIPGALVDVELEETLTVGNGLGWARNTDQVGDAARITPVLHPQPASESNKINPIHISASIDMGMPLQSVDSAYHNIIVARNADRYSLDLAGGTVSMTQDFVLNWQAEAASVPQAALFTETLEGEDYALLMIVPPQPTNGAATDHSSLPKEQIFIIDTSGSMGGAPLRQAQQSLLAALQQLQPQDRFNIIEFNSFTRPLFPQALPANPGNVQQARQLVEQLHASGGTEMLAALQLALMQPAEESHLRQVIFITDGAVGNEAALFKLIQQRLGSSRLFTVGIGAAPNSFFMRKAAQFGRGSFTHIGNVAEVGPNMSALFNKLNNPIMRQISVQWPADITAENYPDRVPDLYQGEPLLLSSRLSALPDSVTISGETAGVNWRRQLDVNPEESIDDAGKGVATLWARQKIASLLDEIIAGREEHEVRQLVLPVALTHKLVSPYSSFVAVEQQVSRTAEEELRTTPVPNAQPHGQAAQSYAYPRGATGAAQSIAWGMLLGVFAAIFHFSIRKESQYAQAA